jgi:hypothetical protein
MSVVLNRNSKRVWIGVILIMLGLSLVVPSYFNVYSQETKKIAQRVLLMEGNSSADLNISFPVHASRALIWVVGSPELQTVLNSTLNYSSSVGNPITITLSDGTRNMSASVYWVAVFGDYWLPQPVYASWFSIPSDWSSVSRVSISNSENHSVCWIETCIFYDQILHFDWLAVMLLGVISLLIGAVISVSTIHRRTV